MSDLDAEIDALSTELFSDELSTELDLEDLFGLGDSEVETGVVTKPAAKKCKHCGETDPDKLFKRWDSKTNKTYTRNLCIDCHRRKAREKEKFERKSGKYVGKYILRDSRDFDRKKSFENDLTLAFIEKNIKKGCLYCSRTSLKMNLDRIDNNIGHLMSNVVPSCISCNYLRRDMPYAAWLILVPRIRRVVDKGLFGNWVCRARGSNK